jgi:hypothetical protein
VAPSPYLVLLIHDGDRNTDGRITMKVPFDVPAGTVPTVIELRDSAFSEGARVRVN